MILTELFGTLEVASITTDRSTCYKMTLLCMMVASGILAFWICQILSFHGSFHPLNFIPPKEELVCSEGIRDGVAIMKFDI